MYEAIDSLYLILSWLIVILIVVGMVSEKRRKL